MIQNTDDLNEERLVTGNMRSDPDLSMIRDPDIVESHNTRVGPNGANTQFGRTPIIGTDLVPFSIGDPAGIQDKIVRITPTLFVLDGQQHSITLRFYNRISNTPAGSSQTGLFANITLASFKTFIDGLVTASGFTYSSSLNLTTNSVDYTFATEDCIITTTNSIYDFTIDVIQELITADEAGGNLKPFPPENTGDFVYILSCNKDFIPDSNFAIGEVGRATYDDNYGVWNYTRLIQSKEFRFLTTVQPDNPKIEQNDYRVSIYWVAKNNPPKTLYADVINSKFSLDAGATVLTANDLSVDLSKIYYADGQAKINVCGEQRTISNIDNTNKTITVTAAFSTPYQSVYVDLQDICLDYRYNTGYGLNYDYIKSETDQFVITDNINIDFLSEESGGSVTSGNKRYSARGVTADLVEYGWSRVSGVVPVYSSAQVPTTTGDLNNINSGKTVKLRLSNIDSTFFSYVDVAVINYNNGFPSAEFVTRISINGSEIDITHIGSENGGTVDLNTITDTSIYFEYGYTNEIVSNRNVIANVKIVQPSDFTEFCLGVTHEIARNLLTDTPTTIDNNSLLFGEYMNPKNVFYYGSGVVNETYRAAFRITEHSGAISNTWVDDVVINDSLTNVTASTIYNGQLLPNRRTATVANLDLTDDLSVPYYYYIVFSPDWSILINGKPPQEVIKSIEVVFTVTPREVLTNGIAIPSSQFYTDGVALPGGFRRPWFCYANKVEVQLDRNKVTFYSPDILLGQTEINFTSGDQLWIYGRQTPVLDLTADPTYRYQLYRGDMSLGGVSTVFQKLDIEDVQAANKLGQVTLGTTGAIFFQNLSGSSGAPPSVWAHENTLSIKFPAGVFMNNHGAVADTTPAYYVQYVRPQSYLSPDNCKFGPVATSVYYPVGNIPTQVNYSTTVINGIINDSFIQSFHFKEIYPIKFSTVYTETTSGYGLTFYCQNIGNSQMRAFTPDSTGTRLFPNSFARFTILVALQKWLSYQYYADNVIVQDEFSYDKSYTYASGVQPEIGANPNLPKIIVASQAIYWSDKKAQNSLSDPYRRIVSGNVHYLDAVDGPINDIFEFGTELYVNQDFNTRRLFFNETGQLQTAPDLSVIIGDGSVMGRDGYSITKFGSKHQQSNILGVSENGNDVRYWWDAINNKIVRFGGNGIDPISDTKLMNFDSKQRTKWASLFNYPAYAYGVHGTFDMQNREMLMTFRGQKIVADFNVGSYTTGDVVASTTAYTPNFYSLPKTLYRAKITGVLAAPTGLANDPNWSFVPLSDTDYYSWTTFVYSEITKGFSAYYDFVPKVMGRYKTFFLSSRPVDGTELFIYTHNKGTEICRWWDDGGNYFSADPTVTIPFNVKPDETKKWCYIKVDADEQPYRADFTAVDDGKVSYLTQSEFNQRRDMWVSPIKNDSTVSGSNPSGLNSLHTGPLRSKVLTVLYNMGPSQVMRTLRRVFVKSRELDKKTGA